MRRIDRAAESTIHMREWHASLFGCANGGRIEIVDDPGERFDDWRTRGRADEPSDFVSRFEKDQRGPQLDAIRASERAAAAVFDLDVRHGGEIFERRFDERLCGETMTAPRCPELENQRASPRIDLGAGGLGGFEGRAEWHGQSVCRPAEAGSIRNYHPLERKASLNASKASLNASLNASSPTCASPPRTSHAREASAAPPAGSRSHPRAAAACARSRPTLP